MSVVVLRTYQQILGPMYGTVLANTDLTDVNTGSGLDTILQAAASSDFTIEGKLLQLLAIRDVDQASGVDLTNLAAELGLNPSRIGAQKASVSLTVTDTAFTKISTQVYSGLAAPVAGDTAVAVISAAAFAASGNAYIGRGTSTSEAVSYASVTNAGSYWLLNLSSPLQKNHLVGEQVVFSQGGDRNITNGDLAQVTPSAGIPSVTFSVNQNYVIPDGETTITGVLATCTVAGGNGNVGKGTIDQWQAEPFPTASVTNPNPAVEGTDPETDTALRQRIKNWVHTIGKGTVTSVSTGVVNVSDPVQGDRVVSAFYQAPTSIGQMALLFIDDGTTAGFQPTFAGVGEEDIVLNAAGTEQFIQLQNWPVMKAQLSSVNTEPFALVGGEQLTFTVDGTAESHTIPASSYVNPGNALAQEVAQAINFAFTTVEARAKAGQLFVQPVADNPGYIQVNASTNDANTLLALPLNKQFTLRLYKDDALLFANGVPAVAQTKPSSEWPGFSSSETLQLTVDGILGPVVTYTDSFFAANTGSLTISGASPSDWAIVFSLTLIGVTSTALSDGTVTLTSNKGNSALAEVFVSGGSLNGSLFPAGAGSRGANSDYLLNRLLGQIQLTNRLSLGDSLKAGDVNTRAFFLSTTAASYSLPVGLLNGLAGMVAVVADATSIQLAVAQTGTVVLTSPSAGIQRVTGATGQFSIVNPDDYAMLYGLPRAPAILKVIDVAANGSYVDFLDPSPAAGSQALDGVNYRIRFFRTAGVPQLWILPIGATVANSVVANSFNSSVAGALATVIDTGAIEFQTLAFSSAEGLAFPAVCGNAINLGIQEGSLTSNDPQLGNVVSGDLAGLPSGRIVVGTPDTASPYTTLTAAGTTWTSPKYNNLPILTYIGSAEQFIRQPSQLSSSSLVNLRTTLPQQCVGFGADARITNTDGLELGQDDNIVFLVDGNATTKTFNIPSFVEGIVTGPTVPSTTQMDATDLNGNDLGGSAAWLGYAFGDYRILCQARVDMMTQGPNTGVRTTAVLWGDNGKQLQVGYVYPQAPGLSPSASFSIDNVNNVVDINIVLGSGSARSIGLAPGAPMFIDTSGAGPSYPFQIQFAPPVSLSTVLPGDIASLTDGSFSSNNLGSFQVSAVSNLVDSSKQYQFLVESNFGDISGGTTLTVDNAPTQTIRTGDMISATGQAATVSSVSTNQIVVPAASNFTAGPGTVTDGANTFTYTTYTSGTGIFAGVSPNPVGIVNPGDTLEQAFASPFTATVVSGTFPTFTVTAGIPNGTDYVLSITHAALTVSSAPSFTPAVGDVIQVLSNVYRVTTVYSSTVLGVTNPFNFTGLQAGVISRLWLQGTRYVAGTTEQDTALSSQSAVVYPLNSGGNTASSLIAVANGTAGVNEIALLSNSAGSNGSGTITMSTQDSTGSKYQPLINGSSWVLSSVNAHPSITLKYPLDTPLAIGEHFRLQIASAQNAHDHLSSLQVSGLTVVANVDLINDGRRVQVSTLIPGGLGQVWAVGGRASGLNVLAVRNNGQQISNSVGVLELDISAMDFLQPGHTIAVSQTGRARKTLPVLGPSDTITVTVPGLGQAVATLSEPVASIYSYTHTGTVVWAVRKISRSRVRYEVYSGTASLPALLQADDWVLVGNGSSYAGTTPATFFASANTGILQIRETDGSTYFDVDNVSAVEQWVDATSHPFIFSTYNSAQVGDQIVIGTDAPNTSGNKGTFLVTSVPSTFSVGYPNANGANEGPLTLGAGGANSVFILDRGYSTYRKVLQTAPKPSDPSNRCFVSVSPGYNTGLLGESSQAQVKLPNRLSFPSQPVPGINGYQYWTGLLQTIQRTIDGYAPQAQSYPGIDAAGVFIEVRAPQIQQVALGIKVATVNGVALSSISDAIKNAVVGYVNSLGLGQPVVLSEVISLVQAVPGVASVVFVTPAPNTIQITVADKAVARTSSGAVTLS